MFDYLLSIAREIKRKLMYHLFTFQMNRHVVNEARKNSVPLITLLLPIREDHFSQVQGGEKSKGLVMEYQQTSDRD